MGAQPDQPLEGRLICHPADDHRLQDPAFWALAQPAYELAQELTGAHTYSESSVGFPTKVTFGHCRLCGQFKKLTFEHLPPRSAGNSTKRRFVSAFDILEAEDIGTFPSRGAVIQQRGSGFHVLCGDCNALLSNLGYVEEYRCLVGATAKALVDFVGDLPEESSFPDKVRLQVQDLRPGRIVRQALAMLMCASASPHFAGLFPQLRDCVLLGTPSALPMGMSLHVAIVAGPRGRLAPPIAVVDFEAGEWAVLMEATFAPLSWILRLSNSPPDLLATNVSEWTTMDVDEVKAFDFVTQAGFVYGAVPLDYRPACDFPKDETGA